MKDNKFNSEYFFGRLKDSVRMTFHSPLRAIVVFLYLLAVTLLFLLLHTVPAPGFLDKLNKFFAYLMLIMGGTVLFVGGLLFSAIPFGMSKAKAAFESVGLRNSAGFPPLMVKRAKEGNKIIMEFQSFGTSRKAVEDKKAELETAWNLHITSIKNGRDQQHFCIVAIPGHVKLPDLLPFPDTLPADKDKIYLGESLEGVVTWDYRSIPHILIGGSTGSGKTMLAKVILTQLLADERCMVFLIDMKGGTDYADLDFSNGGKIISEPEEAAKLLQDTVEELEARKKAFASVTHNGQPVACPDLDTYNRLNPDKPVARIFLAVDELAELTDTTGMTKEDKARSAEMVAALSKIARLGRAFGIHLILSTQRPDANVVPGQIKNNVSFRVCGKTADTVLSTIILDNGNATEIPRENHGLFLTHDGTLFRGYYLEPNQEVI